MAPWGGNAAHNCCRGDTLELPNFTQLINCPFAASAYFQKKANHWKCTFSNPNHNHHHSLDPTVNSLTPSRNLLRSIIYTWNFGVTGGKVILIRRDGPPLIFNALLMGMETSQIWVN
ncbi:uncharacterized protein VP01_548g1 [Puccinia sorghi]|uniref:Uncharacterized protein n=1 Tax=Puccinia sorghi TaxID=27349 RepID=A0A0L6UK69_9BASI|nr:uncharacterized protein VP01_548g1 [Puccinia sorghi]